MHHILLKSALLVAVLSCARIFISQDTSPVFLLSAFLAILTVVYHFIQVNLKDEKSAFFHEVVQTDYKLVEDETAIDAYDRLKLHLMDKVESARIRDGRVSELCADWVNELDPKELQVLIMSLRKRMHRNITCLATLEGDKRGYLTLWKHKVISEEQWKNLLMREDELTQEIEECTLEAEELQPGWRETLWEESHRFWWQTRQFEEKKHLQQQRVNEEKKAEEERANKLEEDRKAEAKTAEKLAASLAREEEVAMERARKKSNAKSAGKKKK